MAEITSTPSNGHGWGNRYDQSAFQRRWRLPPPRKGRWLLPEVLKETPALYWIGSAADLPDAIPDAVNQLMTVQRTLAAIIHGHRIRLKYKPVPLMGRGRREGMYAICDLAPYGDYFIDEDSGELVWYEMAQKPRVEHELSRQLLHTSRQQQKAAKRTT
jgi:hypothetical protein